MTMALIFSTLASILFLWALWSDLRWQIIPNRSVFGLGILWIMEAVRHVAYGGWDGASIVGFSFLCALAIFLFCFLSFTQGWIGGGDAKLAPMGALWVGYGHVTDYIIYTALIGGVLAVSCLVLAVFRKRQRRQGSPLCIPYGVAIALTALWLMHQHLWIDYTVG